MDLQEIVDMINAGKLPPEFVSNTSNELPDAQKSLLVLQTFFKVLEESGYIEKRTESKISLKDIKINQDIIGTYENDLGSHIYNEFHKNLNRQIDEQFRLTNENFLTTPITVNPLVPSIINKDIT